MLEAPETNCIAADLEGAACDEQLEGAEVGAAVLSPDGDSFRSRNTVSWVVVVATATLTLLTLTLLIVEMQMQGLYEYESTMLAGSTTWPATGDLAPECRPAPYNEDPHSQRIAGNGWEDVEDTDIFFMFLEGLDAGSVICNMNGTVENVAVDDGKLYNGDGLSVPWPGVCAMITVTAELTVSLCNDTYSDVPVYVVTSRGKSAEYATYNDLATLVASQRALKAGLPLVPSQATVQDVETV